MVRSPGRPTPILILDAALSTPTVRLSTVAPARQQHRYLRADACRCRNAATSLTKLTSVRPRSHLRGVPVSFTWKINAAFRAYVRQRTTALSARRA